MTWLHVIILAIIEGVTEFLPVSSTGHLVLAGSMLKIQDTEFIKSFEIIIQLGAIAAIFTLYIKKMLTDVALIKTILIGFMPTALVGFTLYRVIKQYLLSNPYIVIYSLFIGGICIIILELLQSRKKPSESTQTTLTARQSFFVGIFQAISIIPGVSRSAASIIGGQLTGLSRKQAVEFSFLLAVPTMVAATGLDLIKSDISYFTSTQWQFLFVGTIVSFITARIVVCGFLQFVEKHSFIIFGIYRMILALCMLIFRPF